MSAQWTRGNPGVGSTGPLTSLATQLSTVEDRLDTGITDLKKADDVFLDQWVGQSADGARTQLATLIAQSKAYGKAITRVRKALDRYATEVAEIKELAAVEIEKRTAAQRILQDEVVTDPHAFEPDRGGIANEKLQKALAAIALLAERRKNADDDVLGEVRAAVATTWEVDPEDYPWDRTWSDRAGYEYVIDDETGVSTDDYTAEEIMDLFKKYPTEVFPFDVSGSSKTFKDGAVFTLSDTIVRDGFIEPYETGDVVVTTTDTSVKFTVISDAYFDGPGSTIEFSIVEVDGEWVLRKTATAVNANQAAATGAEWAAEQTWNIQADNLKDVIDKYGKR